MTFTFRKLINQPNLELYKVYKARSPGPQASLTPMVSNLTNEAIKVWRNRNG